MSLQAFIDESGSGQPPVLIMGGYVATADQWAAFSEEWSSILNMKPSIGYFSMEDALKLDGEFYGISEESRDEKLVFLKRAIDRHVQAGVCCALPYDAFERVFASDPATPPQMRSRYFFAFFGIAFLLAQHQQHAGINGPIDLCFDESVMEMNRVLNAWDSFTQHAPVPKHLLGETPRFADDKRTIPLQAADFCAGMVRLNWIARATGKPRRKMPWEHTKPERVAPLLAFDWDETKLLQHKARTIRPIQPPVR